ncbi:hypothetical protein CC86DRAFT_407181 [Ophiobolus disseminans]|uniref:Uncharacterized protein n=1 Tax=Ophiobolus disseminans TaxID=1469910 RepID=A0A6A6ZZ35_9PLEO|nr:hypothetical protein CC86DRAFT_407181 [Ophiobolus disseminans]
MEVTSTAASLEERILFFLSPFRPPFTYIKPTSADASVKIQLAEQRKAKILARNITFLIRDGERGDKVTREDIFVTMWGFEAWAEGSKGGVLALLVKEAGKSNKILSVLVEVQRKDLIDEYWGKPRLYTWSRNSSRDDAISTVPLFPGESAVDKLFTEVEKSLEDALLGLSKKSNGT